MANLFNFLTGIGDKVQNNGLFQKLIGQDYTSPSYYKKRLEQMPSQEELLKVADMRDEERLGLLPQGSADNAYNALKMQNQPQQVSFGQKLSNALLGKPQETQIDREITEDGLKTGIANAPRQGGFLRDIAGGYQENRFNPISLDNLEPNSDKGFAYRIGEGLGSLARFGESPLGRGLLVGGAIGALGGNPAQMLAYGSGATMLNQGNRMRDRIYRNDLINSQQDSLRNSAEFQALGADEQQEQLQNIANNINSIRGYVDSGTYQQMQQAQQLKDNQAYRNLLLKNQMEQNAINQEYRDKQLALQKRGQDLNYAAAQDKQGIGRTIPAGNVESLSATYQGLIQMSDLYNMIPKLPTRLTTPGASQLSTKNPWDTEAQAFNQYVKTYKQVIGKGLEGGVLRKEDEYKYDQIIPKVGDTAEILKKKTEQLNNMLLNKYNTDLNFLERAGYKTDGLGALATPELNKQNETSAKKPAYKEGQTAIDKKTGKRIIFRGGKWQPI